MESEHHITIDKMTHTKKDNEKREREREIEKFNSMYTFQSIVVELSRIARFFVQFLSLFLFCSERLDNCALSKSYRFSTKAQQQKIVKESSLQ